MQNRIGPNRAGPVRHPPDPGRRHQVLLQGRPACPTGPTASCSAWRRTCSLVPAFLTFAIVPIGGDFNDGSDGIVTIFGHETYLQVADPPIGILLVLAMSSIAVYGVMLAGWSSGSKYPLLGSVRASAQMVSYEAALGPVGRRRSCSSPASLSTNARSSPTQARLRQLEPLGDRPRPVRHLPHRRHRRAQPAAVRPGRGRAGAGRRLPHRVLLDPLRPVLPGRVHERGHHVGHHRHPVPRRPDRPGLRLTGWVSGYVLPIIWFFVKLIVFLFMFVLVPGHAAPVPLRPADGPRLEGAHPAVARLAAAARRRAASAPTRTGTWHRGRSASPCSAWPSVPVCCKLRDPHLGSETRARARTGQESPADGLPRRLRRHVQASGSASTPSPAAGSRCSTRRRSRPKPERLHGRHVLNRYEDGMEKCIGCELCAGVCPAAASTCAAPTTIPTTRRRRASASASSTRSTTCGASTATCASRPARPRRSPRRSCSSSRSPTARTRSTPRTSCSSATTAGPSSCRGRTGDGGDDAAQTSGLDARHRAVGRRRLRGHRRLVRRARLRRARARERRRRRALERRPRPRRPRSRSRS